MKPLIKRTRFAIYILLTAVIVSCSNKEGYKIEIYKTTFTQTVVDEWPRVGKGSMFYHEASAKDGYRILLKYNGEVVNSRYALKHEIESMTNEMLDRTVRMDSISDHYNAKYDTILQRINCR